MNSCFKVILMSATMEGNLDTFMRYFVDVDVAHVDSKLYSVKVFCVIVKSKHELSLSYIF